MALLHQYAAMIEGTQSRITRLFRLKSVGAFTPGTRFVGLRCRELCPTRLTANRNDLVAVRIAFPDLDRLSYEMRIGLRWAAINSDLRASSATGDADLSTEHY